MSGRDLTVVVRAVPRSIADCQLTCIDRLPISLDIARKQHAQYVEIFSSNERIDVIELEELPEHPDSVFVEDVALIFNECAIATRPGAVSRRGEVQGIVEVLHRLRSKVEIVVEPAIVDGGDVAVVGRNVFVGCSTRTNTDGFEQLKRFLEPHGYRCLQVPV